jgi:hypothetical protein
MNFLTDLTTAFAKLAEHLKPNAGAYVAVAVEDVEKILSTILGDIKAELAYLHSRIDQSDASYKSLADATVGTQEQPEAETEPESHEEYHG